MRHSFQFERNSVFASSAAVATSHPTASLIALEMLRKGGNAVDAAIAACAVLCVVEPGMTGIGGDCFAIYANRASGKTVAINGSGAAPAAASTAFFHERNIREIDGSSPHAVTIPGAIDAWCQLVQDHGTMALDEILQPAIRMAEDGYLVQERVAWDWANSAGRLGAQEASAALFLPKGTSPRAGDRHSQPDLATTLRSIARHGRAAFYEGAVAEDMVSTLRGLGGLHTLEDFAGHRGEYVDTIETDYCGARILECPPNGQGIIALMLINLLACLNRKFADISDADRVHLLAEATKLAYRERDRHLADPRSSAVPVEALLSPAWAEQAAAQIELATVGQPQNWATAEHKDTTYLCVVDKDGNAISFINSLFEGFGSTILARKSGVLFHNRGKAFRIDDASPNAIAGGKRPLHTIIPGMAMQGDRPLMPFGVMGGHYQATGHAGLLNNILERGMDVQQAINIPRSFAEGGKLSLEPTMPDSIARDLIARGHVVLRSNAPLGGAQGIWIDHERGVLMAGSDPRKDGCALGY